MSVDHPVKGVNVREDYQGHDIKTHTDVTRNLVDSMIR